MIMENTVVGVYDSYAQAESAMNELLSAGFSRNDVRLSPDSDTGTGTGTTASDTSGGDTHPGSGIGNFFRSLFGMEEHREHGDVYSEAVRRGSCVLTVDAASDEQRDRAVDILNRHDPVDIDERSSHWKSQGWTGYDENAPRLSDSEIQKDRSLYTQGRDMSLTENAGMNIDGGIGSSTDSRMGSSTDSGIGSSTDSRIDSGVDNRVDSGIGAAQTQNLGDDQQRQRDTMIRGQDATRTEGQQAIPVIQEELRVGKREVQRGGVRVFTRVSERPVHEQVELREEHVNVERRPVNEQANPADLAAFKEGSVEMRESAEEAVVSKTARKVEEVLVGKEVTQRTEDINDTVRRTDVDVEQLGASGNIPDSGRRSDFADTTATTDDADYRKHWQTAYGQSGGRYEDYDAAYRYGSQLSGSDRMKNYRWQDVEPDVRSDWESNHPESAWEKVKDAVRYGAERVTGKGH
jgi:uncharacterized protein (TIGR02271 family)